MPHRSRRRLQILSWLILAATAPGAWAQTQPVPFTGTWSRDLESCALSDDEDESRLRITAGTLEEYRDTCAISNGDIFEDGSYRANLTCAAAGRGLLRVYIRDPDHAVFFTATGKRRRSHDGVRCPVQLRGADGLAAPGDSLATLPAPSRAPAKDWAKYRTLCATPGAPNREDACAERRRLGEILRSQGMCHYTRGMRDGWRRCGARGG